MPKPQPPLLRVNPQTSRDLEWERILAALARHCQSEPGQAAARATAILSRAEDIRRVLSVTALVDDLEARHRFLALGDLEDCLDLLKVIRKEGVLDPPELLRILHVATLSIEASQLGREVEESHRLLSEELEAVAPLFDLAAILHKSISDQGEVKDEASPLLKDIRRRIREKSGHIKSRIQRYLTDHDMQANLQDTYYTVRDERYVLPVKAHEKRQIPGIIHGTSNTGQTVYIEPDELVGMNNELKLLEAEQDQEIRRILRQLSQMVAWSADELAVNQAVLAEMDRLAAAARLGREIEGSYVEVREPGPEGFGLHYLRARHPLLLLRKVTVVPNDLLMGYGAHRVLVLSGPNTGGKTVALKTIGLITLMVQAGLPAPVADGSLLTPYDLCWCDISDEQSIEEDLSTFSANIRVLNAMWDNAGPGSLLLIDEIITGTDPLQGSALAISFLESFEHKDAHTVVTTHYEQVKMAAQSTEGFANAAVGFDPHSGRPNFRLSLGVPGTSSALRIAQDLKVNPDVLARAEALMGGKGMDLETIIQTLNQRMAEVERQRMDLDAETARLKGLEDKVQQRQKVLQERSDELNRERLGAKRKAYLETLEELKGLMREARQPEATPVQVQKARDEVSRLEQEVPREDTPAARKRPEHFSPMSTTDIRVGDQVWVEGYGRTGTVLEPADKQGNVLVEVGRIKSRVSVTHLFGGKGEERKSENVTDVSVSRAPDAQDMSVSLDLRGMRVDEAIMELERFLDRCLTMNMEQVSIIHGHGTGALKRAVREYLVNWPHTGSMSSPPPEAGGDGLTDLRFK